MPVLFDVAGAHAAWCASNTFGYTAVKERGKLFVFIESANSFVYSLYPREAVTAEEE